MTRPALAVALDLAPHPEGGFYRRTWTSSVVVDTPHGPRPSATAVLYLLDGSSRWHRVRSAELWCWHRGSALELRHGGTGPTPSAPLTVRLDGDGPQAEVPAATWQAARLLGPDLALVTCVVSPGFDFADFELLPP